MYVNCEICLFVRFHLPAEGTVAAGARAGVLIDTIHNHVHVLVHQGKSCFSYVLVFHCV